MAEGRAEQGVVCCWTGTGASIAANKVHGVRAALCGDAETARGARRWNDANVLALSLRSTSEAVLEEILDAWFDGRAERATQTTWRTSATWTRSADAWRRSPAASARRGAVAASAGRLCAVLTPTSS